MVSNCRICGEKAYVIFNFVTYQWYKCPYCGFCFSSTMIESGKEAIEQSYRQFYESPQQMKPLSGQDPRKLKMWRKTLDIVDKSITKLNERKLLDIGCGIGLFCNIAREKQWIAQGLDISEARTEYARSTFGLNVSTGTIEEVNFPPRVSMLSQCGMLLSILKNLGGQLLKSIEFSNQNVCFLPVHRMLIIL